MRYLIFTLIFIFTNSFGQNSYLKLSTDSFYGGKESSDNVIDSDRVFDLYSFLTQGEIEKTPANQADVNKIIREVNESLSKFNRLMGNVYSVQALSNFHFFSEDSTQGHVGVFYKCENPYKRTDVLVKYYIEETVPYIYEFIIKEIDVEKSYFQQILNHSMYKNSSTNKKLVEIGFGTLGLDTNSCDYYELKFSSVKNQSSSYSKLFYSKKLETCYSLTPLKMLEIYSEVVSKYYVDYHDLDYLIDYAGRIGEKDSVFKYQLKKYSRSILKYDSIQTEEAINYFEGLNSKRAYEVLMGYSYAIKFDLKKTREYVALVFQEDSLNRTAYYYLISLLLEEKSPLLKGVIKEYVSKFPSSLNRMEKFDEYKIEILDNPKRTYFLRSTEIEF